MVDAGQAAKNWQTGMSQAGEKAKAGVNAVTTAPTELAVAAIPRQVAGVQAAAASGKTERGLRSVSLASWRNSYITKGIPRMATGATSGMPKMQNFMSQFLPFVASTVAALPPRGDLESNIARATQMMRATSQFNYQKQNS